MYESILLKKEPKIEFQLLDNGFELVDEITNQNSGYYPYRDLQSVELNKAWFPRLAKWLRMTSWVLNGAPLFPDPEECKTAKVTIHLNKMELGMWLTDIQMAQKAKKLKAFLENKTQFDQA